MSSKTRLAQAVEKHLNQMDKERQRLATDLPDCPGAIASIQVGIYQIEQLRRALEDYTGPDYDACLQRDEDKAMLDCGCILGRLGMGEPYIKFCMHHKPPEILRPVPSDKSDRRGQ